MEGVGGLGAGLEQGLEVVDETGKGRSEVATAVRAAYVGISARVQCMYMDALGECLGKAVGRYLVRKARRDAHMMRLEVTSYTLRR